MKKNILPIIVAALLIAQIVSLIKISGLQNQLDNVSGSISSMTSNTQNQISALYTNIDEKLKQEASPLETASTVLGTLDIDNLTVPVTFSVTPKEVSEYTTVSLDIDGDLTPMEKAGTTFTAALDCDVFGSASPLVVLNENGVTKTAQDERIMIGDIRDRFFPVMYPTFGDGQAQYGAGEYTRTGALNTEYKGAESGIVFTEMRLVIKLDEEIISDALLPDDRQIDIAVPMEDGQTCTVTLIAIDSAGLEHRYMLERFTEGMPHQYGPDYEPNFESGFDNEQIYSADGALLWESEYAGTF